ncbi:DHA2 family efflux MFS transporter permease subunit [Nocardioides bigeumensis]|uniref:MFS transporter n=1 Tax=Nocardioides bigeumensis TaxID=433657 RepID=A0ABP5JRC5_9ACTN
MPRHSSARIPASRVLLVACFGAFLAFLDATIVNVAFPSLRDSFPDTSISDLSWVLNAYNIVFAAFLIVCGRLTDLLGRRRAFATGVLLFTVASALCGAAPSVELLVAARVLQALGAALLVPASLALVVEAFPVERRAHAIGLWGASAAVAAGVGPPIGGALVQLGDWRWAFLVNLPFGVVALWAARNHLVESRAPGRRALPDLVGAALMAAALALLTLGLVQSSDWGWGSLGVIGAFVASVVLLGVFVATSRRHPSPLLDPALLRLPSFSVGSLATAVAGVGFYAYLLTNILWLQYIWGYGVLRAGLALVPAALVAAVVASRLGPLAERRGFRIFIVPGALVWAGAYLWYEQQVGLEPAFLTQWLPGQVLSGIGVGATLPLLGSAALAAVPGGRYATASAVVSSARQLGGVLGIAVLVLIIGEPTPATAVDVLRDGWLLSVGAFVVTALIALTLRTPQRAEAEEETEVHRPAVVLAPDPGPAPRVTPQLDGELAHDLSDVPLVAALPASARQQLEDASRLVPVPAGTWLMREGEPTGSAYVVRGGRFEVEVGGRIVRELGPGEVLGELALLTGEPRSASVRSRRDSLVSEIPRLAFEEALASDASASRFVLRQVAERLRTAGEPAAAPRATAPSVISVVGLRRGVAVADVAHRVARRIGQHLSVVLLDNVDADGLERAERAHDRVVLVAEHPAGVGDEVDEEATRWRDFCVRMADVVVLVGDATVDVPSDLPTPSCQPEVLLLGATLPPEARAAWVRATDAWRLTLVASDQPGDLAGGLRALADRLAGRSLGLVLAGGGARAFAHVGVLRELEDAGLHVDRVAGCSIGAIIAAVHATGRTGEELEDECYAEWVRRKPFSDWGIPSKSLSKARRVSAGMERALGKDEVFEGLPRQARLVSVDLVSRSRQNHDRGNLSQAALASVRLPVLFPPMPQQDGRLLVDGGVLDNLPVDLLTERAEGPVVAVNIGIGGETRPRTGPPRVPALGETLLRTMMIGSGGAVAAARARGAWVLSPSSMGVGLLEFHQLDRMILAGRAAARTLLEQAEGDLRNPPLTDAAPTPDAEPLPSPTAPVGG